MSRGKKVLSWMDDDDRRRPPMSQARAMTSPRTSSMGGAPPLLAVNGRGYTVLYVHNESSASTWTGSRGGGTWQTGAKVSAQASPMEFHSSSN